MMATNNFMQGTSMGIPRAPNVKPISTASRYYGMIMTSYLFTRILIITEMLHNQQGEAATGSFGWVKTATLMFFFGLSSDGYIGIQISTCVIVMPQAVYTFSTCTLHMENTYLIRVEFSSEYIFSPS